MMRLPVAIMVATHKRYPLPEDSGYLPVHVGKALSNTDLGIAGDDAGENISSLNRHFCELTGLFWLWKNVDAEIYGLVHYRRHFRAQDEAVTVNGQTVASSASLVRHLGDADVLVAAPRSYYVETVLSHYRHAHHLGDLMAVRAVLAERYPDHLIHFDAFLQHRSLSLYNMCVMRRHDFHDYCDWLFGLLFEVRERIPYERYGPYQGRVFGFLAERLLNVWLLVRGDALKVRRWPVLNLEGERLARKVGGLLVRRLFGVREA